MELIMPKRILSGVVVSSKSNKTITVDVTRRIKHKLYKKIIRQTKKYHVHDENNEFNVGDVVSIIESKPISKLKRWLTLLFRVLALAALALMIARPMTGGDSLFSFSNGNPEVIVLVLDRSASMETTTDKDSLTKREKALEAFKSFARQNIFKSYE